MNDTSTCTAGRHDVETKTAAGNSLHLVGSYLPITENWLYRRLSGLTRYPPVVLADELRNAEDYPLKQIHVFGRAPRWQRALRRLTGNLGYHLITGWPFAYLNAYYRELSVAAPGIVHSHFAPVAVRFRTLRTLARRRFGCPTVCSFYGYDLRGLMPGQKWPGFDQLLSEETAFIVQGPRMAERLAELGCDSSKIYVNPLGIDLSLFPERTTRYDGRCLRVFTVGRLVEKKGIADAVRAVTLAHRKGANISLTVAGDGELRPSIEAIIEIEGAAGFVKLLGTMDYTSLCRLYYSHDVCLQPSVTAANGDTEGGANMCIIEAMAAGLPIVATRHADTATTVAEGENSFLADEHCPEQLTVALLELAGNLELWQSFSIAGRARAFQLFDAQKQAAELEAVYDQILARM